MDNLNHYTNLQPIEFEQKKYGDYVTVTDGPGSGALGLPGDYTSASRFVRAAFLREYSNHEGGAKEGLTSILHILNSVDIPKGVKITQKDVSDYTQYKGIMDLNNLNYYLMRYNDTELTRVRLTDKLLNQSKVKVF
jgi:choloylglycine hydrolase